MNESSPFVVTKPHERALVRTLLFVTQHSRGSNPSIDAADLVRQLSNEYSGKSRASLQQVADLLASKVSIVDALEQTPMALDSNAVMALRLAHQTGSIERTLEGLIAPNHDFDRPRSESAQDSPGGLTQNGSQLLWAWLLVSFLMMFIVPTIEYMFDEFGMELPFAMNLLIGLSRSVSSYFLLFVLFIAFLYLIERRLKGKRMWWRGMRTTSSEQISNLLNLLAMVVGQGRPVASGLATLANYHPTATIRARLAKATQMIQHGMPSWDALAEQKVISPTEARALARLEPATEIIPSNDVSSIDQTERFRRTQAWMLRYIASRRSGRAWIRNGILLRVLSIGSLLVIAAVVSLAAIAMFQSVYSLVDSLA